MPNILSDLVIGECSLVDHPANSSIDPRTGRKVERAVVALYKRADDELPESIDTLYRKETVNGKTVWKKLLSPDHYIQPRKKFKDKDDPGTEDVASDPPQFITTPPVSSDMQSGERKPKSKKNRKRKQVAKRYIEVLKAAPNRSEIEDAVMAKAARIAKRQGISIVEAEQKAWARNGGLALRCYEAAPVGEPKQAVRKFNQATTAEVELHGLALEIQKAEHCTYPQALTQALYDNPQLYAEYEAEKSAGRMPHKIAESCQPTETRSEPHPMYDKRKKKKSSGGVGMGDLDPNFEDDFSGNPDDDDDDDDTSADDKLDFDEDKRRKRKSTMDDDKCSTRKQFRESYARTTQLLRKLTGEES